MDSHCQAAKVLKNVFFVCLAVQKFLHEKQGYYL
jgi:hypothetical protein